MDRRALIRVVIILALFYLGAQSVIPENYEIAYSFAEPFHLCTTKDCLVKYEVSVGNVGWENQHEIALRFRPPITGPRENRFQVLMSRARRVPAEWEPDDEGGRLVFGPLDRSKWAAVRFELTAEDRESILKPEEIVAEIIPEQGRVVKGHPVVLRFFRAIGSVFRLFAW